MPPSRCPNASDGARHEDHRRPRHRHLSLPHFVTPRIDTDQGLCGLGDATLNGRELAVASYLADRLVPPLIGRNARAIEDTWHYFCRGAY